MIIEKYTACFNCPKGRLKDFGFIQPVHEGFERGLVGCNLCGATKETWLGKRFTRETGAGYVVYKK